MFYESCIKMNLIVIAISNSMDQDPNNSGKPNIAYYLDLAKKLSINAIVIASKESKDLILYCSNKAQIVLSNSDWASSVLASKDLWNEDNILFYPDNRINSVEPLERAIKSLKAGSDFVFGAYQTDNISSFGSIEYDRKTKDLLVCEKPNAITPGLSWRFLGFKNNSKSENLFNIFSQTNQFLYLKNFDIVYL